MEFQVGTIWEYGTECVQNVVTKWKENSATLKNMEGPAAHPLNRDSSECDDDGVCE